MNYGIYFRKARIESAERLALPELRNTKLAAAKIGFTQGYLRKLESGEKACPSIQILESMAAAYGLQIGDLFPSQAPKGREADAIIAPLMVLPQEVRSRFITQMGALARMLASEISAPNNGMGSIEWSPVTTSSQGEKVWRNEESEERTTWRGQPRRQKGRKKNRTNDQTEVGGDLGLPDTEKQ